MDGCWLISVGAVGMWATLFQRCRHVHSLAVCVVNGITVAPLKEAIEFPACGVEGALLILGCSVADQWSALIINGCEHKLGDRPFSQPRRFMQVADEFAAQQP